MEFRTITARTKAGQVLAKADVAVFRAGTQTQVTIYDETGTALTSATSKTDANGQLGFKVGNGQYDIRASLGSTVTQIENVEFNFPLDFASRASLVSYWSDGLHPDGSIVSDGRVSYVASAGATGISDLPGLLPFGDVTLEHFGGSAGGTSTANRAAMDAAVAFTNQITLLPGFYFFGTTVYEITKSSLTIRAQFPGRTTLFWQGANASGIKVRPTNVDNGSFINSVRLLGFSIVGPQMAHTSGIGFEAVMCNACEFDIAVIGWERCIRLAGGQQNRWPRMVASARTGGVVSDVSGSYALSCGPHIQEDDTARPFYTTTVDYVLLTGSPNKNVEHTIRLGGSDGLNFVAGDVNYGRTANLYLEPEADSGPGNVTATNFGQVYFDGVGQADGSDYGIVFGDTAFTGRVNYLRLGAGCFVGNYQKSAIYSRGNSLIGLFIDGANLSGCSERVVDIVGVTGASGSRIVIGGATQVGNGTLGGVKIVGGRLVQVSNTSFTGNSGSDGALYVGGTISDLVVQSNSYAGNSADFTNAGSKRPRSDVIEGTSTPTVAFGGASVGVTYSTQFCAYSVIGNRVFVNARVVLTSKGTSTGEFRLNLNLPVSLANTDFAAAAISVNNLAASSSNQMVVADVLLTSSSVRFNEMATSATDFRIPWSDANIENNSVFIVSANWPIAP